MGSKDSLAICLLLPQNVVFFKVEKGVGEGGGSKALSAFAHMLLDLMCI